MTTAELIQLLQGCDPNQRVIVHGYEGGYHDVALLHSKKIKLNVYRQWYYGPHDTADDDGPYDEIAVLIDYNTNPR